MVDSPEIEARFNEAKGIVTSVLQLLSIVEVIYIDDIFDQKVNVERIIAWTANAFKKAESDIIELMSDLDGVSVGDEGFNQVIRDNWEAFSPEEKDIFVSKISEVCGVDFEFSKDIIGSNTLSKFFNGQICFLSPSQWNNEKKAEVLEKASEKSRYLCLFDHDLHEANGFQAEGSLSGAGLINDIVALGKVDADNADLIICGLLTHTISEINSEMTRWREIGNQYKIDLGHFLPIAKKRLSDEDPLVFANGIHKTILNCYCERLKSTFLQVIEQAIPEAVRKLQSVDVYEFEYIVLRSSFDASEWEVFTLTRLFQIFEKDEILTGLLRNNNPTFFNKIVKKARPIAQLWSNEKDTNVSLFTRHVRRQELFENKTTMVYSSLQLGDIFQDTNGNHHILLAQPCDLIIRKEGHRNNKNLAVAIVPIETMGERADEENYWETHAKLNYFNEDNSDPVVITFRKALWITVDILDLAVFHPEANCSIKIIDEINPPSEVPDWWSWRYKKLYTKFKSIAEDLVKVDRSLMKLEDLEERNFIASFCTPKKMVGGLSSVEPFFNDNEFQFGLTRVLRFREPYASRLLREFTLYLSRDAEETDFAKSGLAWDLPGFYKK